MKKPFLSNPVRSLQLRIFCLVLLGNLALLFGLMAIFARMSGIPEAPQLFAGSAFLASLGTVWFGICASRSRIFLSYQRATQVYYPGMAISLLLTGLAYLAIKNIWASQGPVWILVLAAGLFMVVSLGIKLSNARHALD
jgi:hypothetical protein